jgi:DNA-binding response OmpR family regulator
VWQNPEMDQANGREPVVVLVEDNPTDLDLFVRIAKRVIPHVQVRTAESIAKGTELIHEAANREDLRLVVLDFVVGSDTAMELLAHLRSPSTLLRVPIVLFTGRASIEDVDLAERIGANSVIRKPSDAHEFDSQVETMLRYWVSKNIVPLKAR